MPKPSVEVKYRQAGRKHAAYSSDVRGGYPKTNLPSQSDRGGCGAMGEVGPLAPDMTRGQTPIRERRRSAQFAPAGSRTPDYGYA